MFLNDWLKRLTDRYVKSEKSNIGKLLKIVNDQIAELKSTFERIDEWRDVEKARGKALDDVGSNVGQVRGVATDEVYRILIRSKIARNISTGTINSIINALSTALNCPKSEIKIIENPDDQPACIGLISMPLDYLNKAGLSVNQFGRIVQKTVSAGIKVQSLSFGGTFEYVSSIQTEQSTGYADIDMTIGGTLGAAYTPSNDNDLPL